VASMHVALAAQFQSVSVSSSEDDREFGAPPSQLALWQALQLAVTGRLRFVIAASPGAHIPRPGGARRAAGGSLAAAQPQRLARCRRFSPTRSVPRSVEVRAPHLDRSVHS